MESHLFLFTTSFLFGTSGCHWTTKTFSSFFLFFNKISDGQNCQNQDKCQNNYICHQYHSFTHFKYTQTLFLSQLVYPQKKSLE